MPNDLAALRNALDRGHNITRSDGYALLNECARLSSQLERLKAEQRESGISNGRDLNPHSPGSPPFASDRSPSDSPDTPAPNITKPRVEHLTAIQARWLLKISPTIGLWPELEELLRRRSQQSETPE